MISFKKILIIIVLLINPIYISNKIDVVGRDYYSMQERIYPLKHGKPTSKGIDYYVLVNKFDFIKEFENHIRDSIILDVEISTDNIEEYTGYDTLDLAYHFSYDNGSDEIIIDNRPSFLAYDINDLSKFRKLNLSSNNAFVKTSIMHELGHTYFLQITLITLFNGIKIHPEYDFRNSFSIRIIPNIEGRLTPIQFT